MGSTDSARDSNLIPWFQSFFPIASLISGATLGRVANLGFMKVFCPSSAFHAPRSGELNPLVLPCCRTRPLTMIRKSISTTRRRLNSMQLGSLCFASSSPHTAAVEVRSRTRTRLPTVRYFVRLHVSKRA